MPTKVVIDVAKLPKEEKIEVNYELDPSKLEMEFHDFHYKSKLKIHGFLEKMAEVLMFNGSMRAEAEKTCGRCLEELKSQEKEDFNLVFDIKGKTEIDATEELREVMIFAHPLRFLCREDCKGLCAGCGANLNLEPCKCKN